MTTSANVVEYTIYDAGDKRVGTHRQHCMCKTKWQELLKYQPLRDHKIQAWGYDEDEAYWENDPQNLRDFLIEIAQSHVVEKHLKDLV